VKKGNGLMAQEQYEPALQAYDEAARELPDARGVQLNRGLALLGQDLSEQAKEAFLAAADPSASPATRGDAYYNLGVAYAREGDVISQQEEYEQASAHFREAADAFKRALRVQPGNRNAAWNLEYAMKRIREEEKREQEREQEQEQEQSQDQEQEQSQDQDQEQSQDQDQEQRQDQEQEQSQDQDQEQSQDQDQEQSQDQDQEQQQEQESESENPQPMEPGEVQRFLDALEQNEENLPLQRARRRSAGRPPPDKDW
jgi:tetratricopeptide (TPR) repeat protein